MSTAVLVALITSATSLAVALSSPWLQQRTAKQARQSEAKKVLDRYRGPLLVAASDLGHRINNIRHDDFLLYVNDPDRQVQASRTTLFRFAQYFGWREILRTEVQLLRFHHEKDTQLVARLLAAVRGALKEVGTRDGATIAIDETTLPSELRSFIVDLLPAAATVDARPITRAARMIKTEDEIALLRGAAAAADAGHETLMAVAAAGRNELEVMGDVLTLPALPRRYRDRV